MSKRGRVRTKQSTTLIENTLSDNGIHIYNFLEDLGITYEEFYNKLYEYSINPQKTDLIPPERRASFTPSGRGETP